MHGGALYCVSLHEFDFHCAKMMSSVSRYFLHIKMYLANSENTSSPVVLVYLEKFNMHQILLCCICSGVGSCFYS